MQPIPIRALVALALLPACVINTPGQATADTGRVHTTLTPVLYRSAPRARAAGDFREQVLTVDIGPGSVILSGGMNERDALVVDDALTLTVRRPDGSVSTLRHDFRDRQGAIRPSLPLDVSHLFIHGTHVLTLTLTDLRAPYFSASALVLHHGTPSPEVIVTETPLPSATPVSTPTLSASATTKPPAPTSTSAPAVAQALSTAPTGTPLPRQPAAQLPDTGAAPAGLTTESGVYGLLGAGAVAICALVLIRRRITRRAASAGGLTGVVTLYDRVRGTRLENVDLTAFPNGAVITVDGLGLSALPAPDATPVARLMPVDVEVDDPAASQMGGCMLIILSPDGQERARPLEDGSQVWIAGRLRVSYHAPGDASDALWLPESGA